MTQKEDVNRKTIENFMKERGLKVTPWCRSAGLSEGTLRNYLKGRNQTLNLDTLNRLASAQNVEISLKDGLIVIDESVDKEKFDVNLNSAKIKGYVQAGQWGEAMEILPEEDQTALPIPINFPYKNVYGLLVKGDSMNMEYNEGDQLLCVEMWEYGEENIIPGDHIIVKAISHAGEYETTVKEYWKDEFGHAWLIPRSTERKYERYPIPNGDDIDVVINGKRIQNIIMEAYVYSSTRVRKR